MKQYVYFLVILGLFIPHLATSQLLTNNGGLIHVQNGAGLYVVDGDLLVRSNTGNDGLLDNYGHVEVRSGELRLEEENTVVNNRDTMDIRGNVLTGEATRLELHAGSGMRVTGNMDLNGGVGTYFPVVSVTVPNSFVAHATSLVHFDGDQHVSGTPTPNTLTADIDPILAATSIGAPPANTLANVFGNVRLTTPALQNTDFLVVYGSLDFSDGPSFTEVTDSGEPAATNTAATGDCINIIENLLPGTGGVVMGPAANLHTLGTTDLSVIDQNGSETIEDIFQREMVIGGAGFGWYINPTESSYLFPLGGEVGGVSALQAMRLNYSSPPNAAISYMAANWNPVPMDPIPAPHCIDPASPDEATQWTGTWTYRAIHPTEPAGVTDITASGITYNLSLRPVGYGPDGDVGTVIDHTTAAIEIVNCDATPFNLDATDPQVLFSEAAGYTIPSALNIDELSIRATPQQNHIVVDWAVTSEPAVSHYHLERSLDGESFETIARDIPAAGGMAKRADYRKPDYDVETRQRYYYRVQQVGMDGRAHASAVVQAMLGDDIGQLRASLYPNPATQQLIATIYSPAAAPLTIQVFDSQGKRVYVDRMNLVAGQQSIDMSQQLRTWAVGTYSVLFTCQGKQWQERVIRLKD